MFGSNNKSDKEYVLVAGFRRINACKKLGWNTIPALIRGENKTIDLDINSIEIIDEKNSRLTESDDEMAELMDSIKQHGLLEPVVVMPSDKIDEKEYMVLNIIENIHRKNLSPTELSVVIRKLKNLGLNLTEIAVRLSMSKSRIRSIYEMSNSFKEELAQSDFVEYGKNKGKIPFSTLKTISMSRMRVADKKEVIKIVQEDELTQRDVQNIARFIEHGNSVKKAKKMLNEWDYIEPHLIVSIKELEKLRERYKMNITDLFSAMLTGKIPLNKKLIYFDKEIKENIEE